MRGNDVANKRDDVLIQESYADTLTQAASKCDDRCLLI